MALPVILSWSGGKDSALALHYLLQNPDFEVIGLMTAIGAATQRVTMHGVPVTLMEAQAEAIGLPMDVIEIPADLSNQAYEKVVAEQLKGYIKKGIMHMAFGDIFLEDLRKYREENNAKAGMKSIFPLWKKDTKLLVQEFIAEGFKAAVVCIDPTSINKSFAGADLDQNFIDALPAESDPCGENGEYHSFVYDGPIFNHPVHIKKGKVFERSYAGSDYAFVFQEIY